MGSDERADSARGGPRETGEDLSDRIGEATRRQELADPDAGRGPVARAINRAAEVAGVAVLVTIVATIFANAFGRYAFDLHLLWAEELVLLLMPWLAVIGAFLAVRRGTMIRIDYFYQRLPLRLRATVALAGHVLCVAVLALVGVVSTRFVSLFGADPSPYLDIATGWSTVALAVGGFGVALAFLGVLLRELGEVLGRRGAPRS